MSDLDEEDGEQLAKHCREAEKSGAAIASIMSEVLELVAARVPPDWRGHAFGELAAALLEECADCRGEAFAIEKGAVALAKIARGSQSGGSRFLSTLPRQ